MPLLSWEFEKHQQHIQPVLYSSLLNKLIPAFEERCLNKIWVSSPRGRDQSKTDEGKKENTCEVGDLPRLRFSRETPCPWGQGIVPRLVTVSLDPGKVPAWSRCPINTGRVSGSPLCLPHSLRPGAVLADVSVSSYLLVAYTCYSLLQFYLIHLTNMY